MKKLQRAKDLQGYFADKDKTVVLKFSAAWCNPCRILSSTINAIPEDELNGAIVLDIDVDSAEFDELCQEYKITSIPALFFTKDGMVLAKKVGSISRQEFLNTLKQINKN